MRAPTSILLLAVASTVSGQTEITTDGAIATFSRNGIDGQITVINGHILMNLTFDDNFDFGEIYSDGDTCFTGGMYYGIYDEWEYDSYDDKLGSSNCGSDWTGYRWDPWLACSTSSSNEFCEANEGCVPPSSYKWDADEYEYLCNDISYKSDPFICEFGDLSGKYGLLELDESDNYEILKDISSAFEVDSYDLGGKSIVFRCHDNTRAFCAGFEEYEASEDEIESNIRPYQNNTFSQKAVIGTDSYVLLTYYQRYEIVIDSADMGVPGSCGDEIYYRIFTHWDETGEDCVEKTQFFYDPTVVCADDTENNDDDGKGYCEDYYYLCEDSDWEYSCAPDGYFTDVSGRLSCAPGDLSAKYGSIDISDNVNFEFNISGYDPKMIPMEKLVGKSIVLQCASDNAIIACAPFEDYYDDVGRTVGDGYGVDSTDTDTEDSSKNSKKKDNTFLGLSDTVALIMVILALAAIIPCIKGCRNRKAGAATGATDAVYETKTDKISKQRVESRSNLHRPKQQSGGSNFSQHSQHNSRSQGSRSGYSQTGHNHGHNTQNGHRPAPSHSHTAGGHGGHSSHGGGGGGHGRGGGSRSQTGGGAQGQAQGGQGRGHNQQQSHKQNRIRTVPSMQG